LSNQQPDDTLSVDALIQWLSSLPYPRPFVWQRYVYWRRAIYGLITLLMLVGFVGVPFVNGLAHSRGLEPGARMLTYWTTIILGAFIVSAFVRVSFNSSQLFDTCKWLAQFGAVGEANLLWVLGNEKSINVTYLFHDLHGHERQREANFTSETGQPLPKLRSGDTVPVLFDPHKSDKRNMLWLEVARCVRVTDRPPRRWRKPKSE
jgi:hypothetical protein